MFDHISGTAITLSKILFLCGGILLGFLIHRTKKRAAYATEKKLTRCLMLVALLSFAAFYNFGGFHHGGRHFHTHDLYHYYMGSKYFKETGYFYLYDATLLADEQSGNRLAKTNFVRNQFNYKGLSRADVHNPERLKYWQPKFTPERWNEFKRDAVWFLSQHRWQPNAPIVNDFGYNPTPVWTMTASLISNAIPTHSEAGMLFIVYLDALLALAMFFCIYQSFGLQPMLFSVLLWGSTFTYVYEFTGGSMLRHDWIAYLVISVCLLKKEKPCQAGFFFALSSGLRLFPLLFLLPAIAVFLMRILKEKVIPAWQSWDARDRQAAQFFMSAAGSFMALILLSAMLAPGIWGGWPEFALKMKVHLLRNTFPWGFNDIFLWEGEFSSNLAPGWKEAKAEHLKALWPITGFLKLLTLGLTVRAARKLQYWEMLCLGSLVPFMLLYLSKYYFVYLVILVPFLSSRLDVAWRVKGMALLFALMIAMFAVASFNRADLLLEFLFSLMLYLFYLYILIASAPFKKPLAPA